MSPEAAQFSVPMPRARIDANQGFVNVWKRHPSDARDEGRGLCSDGSDANDPAVTVGPCAADVNIVAVPARDIKCGMIPDGGVIHPGGVAVERSCTAGCVAAPGGVTVERFVADGRVADPSHVAMTVAVASVTWDFAVKWFAHQLGLTDFLGTQLDEDGTIKHVWPRNKAEWLRDLATVLAVPFERTGAVGNSPGDFPMLQAAALRFFVGPRLPWD
jgi:hypothetical protein